MSGPVVRAGPSRAADSVAGSLHLRIARERAYRQGQLAERQRLAALIAAQLSPALARLAQDCTAAEPRQWLETSRARLAGVLAALQGPEAGALSAAAAEWRGEFEAACAAAGIATVVCEERFDEALNIAMAPRLAAARMVREAAANLSRHSRAAQAWLTIRCEGAQLQIEIRDNGRARAAAIVYGRGLTGMRHRALELGGEFRITDAGDGGLVLHMRLPLSAAASTKASPIQGTATTPCTVQAVQIGI